MPSESERHEMRRRWLTVADIAAEMEVSTQQVRQYIHEGRLRARDVSKAGAKRRDYRIKPEWFAAFEKTLDVQPGKVAA